MECARWEMALHQLCGFWFGAEPFLGSDQELSKLGQLFQSQLDDLVRKFVRDGMVPRLAFAKRTERNAKES